MKTLDPVPLYQQLATTVEKMIESGALRAGDRLPSVRQLSRQHGVSVPTVVQAYVLLESSRVIEARPKSGFYVRPRLAAELLEPPRQSRSQGTTTLDRFTSMMAMIRDVGDPKLVPLGTAVASPELMPVEKLSRITASILRRQPAAAFHYDPAPGSLELRKELSRRSLDWGCALDAEDFLVTNGATEAVYLALQAVTKPGDTVLMEVPAYYGLLNAMASLRLKVAAVPASATDGMDLEAAAAVLKKQKIAAILVVPNFNNPLGSLMPEENRRVLLDLALKHRVPVIEDDIYGDLPHEGARPRCLKALDRHDNVILCGSFSKTLAAGYRVGYVSNAKLHDRLLQLKLAANWGGATLTALAVAGFLHTGGYDGHLRRLRHTYLQQVRRMREAVAESFPRGTRVSDPQGGFVLWVELPRGTNALEIAHEARRAGVSVAPGPIFSPTASFPNYLRLNCGYPWSPRVEAAVATLAKLAGRARG